MQTYARISNGQVAEYPVLVGTGFTLEQCYPPQFVALCAPVADGLTVAVGDAAVETDGIWSFSSPTLTPDDLVAHANAKQWALATGGYTVTVGGQARTFATDPISQSLITAKWARLQAAAPPVSVNWQFATGFAAIAAADFVTAAIAVADFVQATFDALAKVEASIAAGTIATAAAVDAFAWPSNG